MQKLQKAYIPKEQIEQNIADLIQKWTDGNKLVRDSFPHVTTQMHAAIAIREFVEHRCDADAQWRNDKYQVAVFDDGETIHLSIKRNDRAPIHDWRDLQEIKNQLVGPEHEAIELYPAESRRIDTANQYHLWVLKDPNQRFPVGFNNGRHCTTEPLGKSVNRPFEE